MSYYQSNYYVNPHPHYWGNTDRGEPVPGWGLSPVMAGPAYVGIGDSRQTPQRQSGDRKRVTKKSSIGWVGLVALAGAMGAAVGIAQNRGMLSKVGLRR